MKFWLCTAPLNSKFSIGRNPVEAAIALRDNSSFTGVGLFAISFCLVLGRAKKDTAAIPFAKLGTHNKSLTTKILLLLTITTLFANQLFAQTKDTIFLNEIKISKQTEGKIFRYKTKGSNSALHGFSIKGMLSRVDHLPKGALKSVTFYFNQKHTLDFSKPTFVYKDVELALLIQHVNPDGTPGTPISNNAITFKVLASHQGSIALDLTPLEISSESSMFFGFELLKAPQNSEFRVMLKTTATAQNSLFLTHWKSSGWKQFVSTQNCILKMALEISVDK